VRIADDTLALFAKTLAAARLRLAAGDIAPSDLSRLNVDALRAENDRRQAQADRDRVRADLALALGLEGDAVPLAAVDAWPAGADATFPADMEAVAGRRADVLAARRRANAFDRFRALAQSLRTRDVTVAAQVERYPGQPHVNTVGVGVTVPLFINYEFDGEIRRAEADRAAAEEAFALAKGAAITEIRQAWSDLAAARDRVRRYDGALLAEAARAADAAAFAYRNGALGVIDLLDAQRTLVATQVDAVTARADLAKALAAWRAAIAAVEDIP
jgi:cobalt-zinc-cadmium efflux system outer membrane protein